jgi:AraC-like DNA-binding protein
MADRNERLGRDESSKRQDGVSPLLKCSDNFDRSWIREIQIRPGFKLSILDFSPLVDTVINFDVEHAQLIFGYFFSGKARSTVNYGFSQERMTINTKTGYCGISFLPHLRVLNKYPAGSPVRGIHIQVDPVLLTVMIKEEFDYMPADFRAIVEGTLGQHYYRSGTMPASMQIALYQMLNCPYQGLTKRLFLESKAVELIALQLEQSVFGNNGARISQALRPADIERIHEAKDLIVHNMQKPPSLLELARQVGLNDFKLKKGFRQVFGKTVFGYLHEHRMEQSRQLLEEGKMNVKEVSYVIGYMNSHSFSDAFKKQFGVRPSAYLQGNDFSLR